MSLFFLFVFLNAFKDQHWCNQHNMWPPNLNLDQHESVSPVSLYDNILYTNLCKSKYLHDNWHITLEGLM